MQPFPGAAHFTSWSGIAPGNHESAGKRKRSPTLRGNPHMKTALVESAWSASRTNGSEFQDRYQRLQPRFRHKRAIVAVAHHHARPEPSPASVQRLIQHHSRRLKHLTDVFRTTQINADNFGGLPVG